jgi:superfamily I DNA/RNA helicase
VLRGFGLELGVPPGWQIIDDEPDEDVRAAAVEAALVSPDLDPRRAAALIRMLNHNGFKRSVYQSILDAILCAYSAYSDSAAEAWEVFGPDAPPPDQAGWRQLINAVRAIEPPQKRDGAPVKSWADNLGAIINGLESGAWKDVLSRTLMSKVADGETEFSSCDISPAVREALRQILTACRRALLQEYKARNIAARDLLSHFDSAYHEIKTRRGWLRFDDVPRLLRAAAATDRLDDLYFRLDGKINHLLLDEFQDTSLDQFKILRPIIDELASQGDEYGSRSVFCVGDVKQSLYSWRGAEPELLPSLKQQWPQFESEPLALNFRSSPVILNAVNCVFGAIGCCSELLEKAPRATKTWQEQFTPHEAQKKDLPGEVRIVVAPDDDGGASPEADSEDPQALDRRTRRARLVAQRVKALREAAPRASIAILTRTNALVPRLIFQIREAGIAAVGEQGNVLTDSPAAAVAISALHLADHPGDTAAYFHIATSPLGRILGLPEVPDENLDPRPIAARLRARIARDGIAGTLERFQSRLAPSMDALAFTRFDQLIQLAEEYEAAGPAPLRPGEFARLARTRPVEPPDHQLGADPVRVMTIHKAKGLEFDAVILPELDKLWTLRPGTVLVDRRDESGRRSPLSPIAVVTMYPNSEVRAADPRLEELYRDRLDRSISEELSGLYVAMTRAKRYLEMILDPTPRSSPYPSPAKVLCHGLAENRQRIAGAILWQSPPGSKFWHAGIDPPQAAAPPFPVDIQLPAVTSLPSAYLSRRSPSSLEGGSRLDLGDLWRGNPGEGDTAAQSRDRGIAFHAMLERIDWLDAGLPTQAVLIQAIRRAGLASPNAEQWARELLALLSERQAGSSPPASTGRKPVPAYPTLFDAVAPEPSPLAAALRRSRYKDRVGTVTLRREWSFALRSGGEDPHLLNGQFDRVAYGVQDSKPFWAEIIDFKTDAIAPADETALRASINHYRPQLEAYKLAAAKLLRLDPDQVSATLIFIGPGRIVSI